MSRNEDQKHHYDTARLEAISDGVIAIAITLLVLEIAVPHVEGGLAAALRDLWPSYIAYALSFLMVGIMWMNHHTMFRDIERTDHTLVVLNILLLMCVSFVPFTTAVLAEYLRDGDQRVVATLAYGATFTITAVVFNGIWLYASHDGRLIDEHVSPRRVRSRTLRYLPGPLLYGASLPLAFVSPWVSLAIYLGLAVLFLLPLPD